MGTEIIIVLDENCADAGGRDVFRESNVVGEDKRVGLTSRCWRKRMALT